ncbi:putative Protein prenyltransferase alpha subunit repeat-containing protein 1 [Seiridium cardinale]|uniref:Protein prenyltransferase n=1 Tax=Seiridium cardinale TaxID=138064 RepID=A0ABR2XYF8_9PEZI
MSRSLDKEVLENLRSEDPTKVYRDIAEVLTTLPRNGGLLDIELLGKAHPLEPGVNYLQDEEAIAIPKLRLTQAFFVAHQAIQKHLVCQPKAPSSDLVAATAVALLMDPEHLTAANIRKRYILSAIHGDEPLETLLRHEKQFLDSLLTARLHRHTKSPNLWSHRRWLMERFKALHLPFELRQDFTSVILSSAERHPRNYYAWHHARWLMCNADPQPTTSVLLEITDDVKDWCFKHHDDISGWTYLDFITLRIEDHEARSHKWSSIIAETFSMTESFRWTNESVWVFLRTLVARGDVDPELSQSLLDLTEKLSPAIVEEAAKKSLDAAIRWISQYHQIMH